MRDQLRYSPCTCGNHHLLEPGDTCELCMGVVENPEFVEEWPEMVMEDPFDDMYFEQLEALHDLHDLAAA